MGNACDLCENSVDKNEILITNQNQKNYIK